MNRILDELVKNSSSCIEKIEKKEEWKRLNEEMKNLNIVMMKDMKIKYNLFFENQEMGKEETEAENVNADINFCSKCNGNYEYCSDHLFTHTHVK